MSDFETFTDNALIAGINSRSMERASMFGGTVDTATTAAVGAIALMRASRIPTKSNYRSLFMQARPDLPKGWQVHHSLPQQYEELMSTVGINIHDVQHLRGVSQPIHATITKEWGRFHKSHGGQPRAADVADFAKEIDRKYDGDFMWPGY